MAVTLESVPFLADVLTGAGLGAFVGAWVAYRHQRRGGTLPRDWVVTRWSVAFAVAGLLIGAVRGLP